MHTMVVALCQKARTAVCRDERDAPRASPDAFLLAEEALDEQKHLISKYIL